MFAPLADRVPLRSSVQRLFSTRNWFYRNVVVDLPADTTYFMVFYLWITFALHALSHCDLVFDMDLAESWLLRGAG